MGTAGEVTIANVDMAAAWDGHEGDIWTEHAERYEATAGRVWKALRDRTPIADGEAVLDIGCGTGHSTLDAARATPSGRVLGVDLSARMLGRARDRAAAEGLAHVRFEQADAQVHPFPEASFDIAISCCGAMFFADPVAAFGNVRGALRPGGRLAVLAWRELARNRWVTVLRDALALGRELPEPQPSAPGPFGLADPEHVRRVLSAAGFVDVGFEPVEEPIYLGRDADDAFSFVRVMGIVEGLTNDLDEGDRARALDQVHAALVAYETVDGVLLPSSAWLITARSPVGASG